ncbi:MAG: hypothetical protein ACWGSQ_12255 [Longimicrobiales bacterium]
MRAPWATALVALIPALFTACATSTPQGITTPRDPNVITLEEIEATDAETAYDIIQQLRPRWMVRNRGQRSFRETEADYAKVFLDELPPREFDFLREIPRASILEMRFLEAREATYLYGTGYNAGVIKVTTKR